MAAVLDLTGFTQAHETVAGTTLAVAGSTEGWNEAHFHQPPYDLIKASLVGNIELLGVVRTLLLCVPPDGCAGCAADLRDADF